jgi:uncharacterized membrane protein YqjE
VAGPGTGKTTAFARALNGDSKDNRVLTFIRNLRAIAMDVAASLLPIAVIEIAQVQHQTFTHVLQAGAAFYAAVVIFAVASQDYALAVLVTLVTGGATATSLTKRSITPTLGSSPP